MVLIDNGPNKEFVSEAGPFHATPSPAVDLYSPNHLPGTHNFGAWKNASIPPDCCPDRRSEGSFGRFFVFFGLYELDEPIFDT